MPGVRARRPPESASRRPRARVIVEVFVLALVSTCARRASRPSTRSLSHDAPRWLMWRVRRRRPRCSRSPSGDRRRRHPRHPPPLRHNKTKAHRRHRRRRGRAGASASGCLPGASSGRRYGDAPGPRAPAAALDRRLTTRTAALAGPATHIPGLFYLIALNVIIAHNAATSGQAVALVIYNAVWFVLPILAAGHLHRPIPTRPEASSGRSSSGPDDHAREHPARRLVRRGHRACHPRRPRAMSRTQRSSLAASGVHVMCIERDCTAVRWPIKRNRLRPPSPAP